MSRCQVGFVTAALCSCHAACRGSNGVTGCDVFVTPPGEVADGGVMFDVAGAPSGAEAAGGQHAPRADPL
eukprot:8849524-Pyramimonas_sp.AAC.2